MHVKKADVVQVRVPASPEAQHRLRQIKTVRRMARLLTEMQVHDREQMAKIIVSASSELRFELEQLHADLQALEILKTMF